MLPPPYSLSIREMAKAVDVHWILLVFDDPDVQATVNRPVDPFAEVGAQHS